MEKQSKDLLPSRGGLVVAAPEGRSVDRHSASTCERRIESVDPPSSEKLTIDQKIRLADLIVSGKSRRDALKEMGLPFCTIPGLFEEPGALEVKEALKELNITPKSVLQKHVEIRDKAADDPKGFSAAVRANEQIGKVVGVFKGESQRGNAPPSGPMMDDLARLIERVTAREVEARVLK